MLQKDNCPPKPKRGLLKSKAFICVIIVISAIAISILQFFAIPIIAEFSNIFDDSPTKEEIIAYVNDNYELLEKFPYEESSANNNWREKVYIKKHLGKDTIVEDVYAYNENILEFGCGGSGLVTGSTYEGFYFSRDDTPFAMDFYYYDGVRFKKNDEGVYEWHNQDGSHRIYTEKIRDNWYYYIEDFY